MKALLFLSCLLLVPTAHAQTADLLQLKNALNGSLKLWSNSFKHFNTADFEEAKDQSSFENLNEQDFKDYKSFLSVYQPILSFSPDKTQFIDIYSYRLPLSKRAGRYFYSGADIDVAVFLCQPRKRYWKRIAFGGSVVEFEEAVWISNTEFLLAGVSNTGDDRMAPFIMVGDARSQRFTIFNNTNKTCMHKAGKYHSLKLQHLKIYDEQLLPKLVRIKTEHL